MARILCHTLFLTLTTSERSLRRACLSPGCPPVSWHPLIRWFLLSLSSSSSYWTAPLWLPRASWYPGKAALALAHGAFVSEGAAALHQRSATGQQLCRWRLPSCSCPRFGSASSCLGAPGKDDRGGRGADANGMQTSSFIIL